MAWTLATAKNQFSEVVRRARSDGPQTISVRGRQAVVVMALDTYKALLPVAGGPKDFKAHLLSAPKIDDPEFYRALERRPFPPRDIDL